MGATILVVDDDSAIRTLMRVVLERAGYSVLVAADGEEGLHIFRQHQDNIALLLTDVGMPRMNGFDLADHVLEPGSQIPVVFTSGTMPDADCGFGCIPKPFKPDALIGKVHEVLEEQKSRIKLRNASRAGSPEWIGSTLKRFRILAAASTASNKIAVIIEGPGIEPGGLRREFSSKTEAHHFVDSMNSGFEERFSGRTKPHNSMLASSPLQEYKPPEDCP